MRNQKLSASNIMTNVAIAFVICSIIGLVAVGFAAVMNWALDTFPKFREFFEKL